jgi:hypothetical protein
MTFQLQIQQCRPLPSPPPTQLRLKNSIRSTLTKQGQRFLTKLTTTTNTDNLIRKFVQSSPKSVLLSTLTHLLSPNNNNNNNNLSFSRSSGKCMLGITLDITVILRKLYSLASIKSR